MAYPLLMAQVLLLLVESLVLIVLLVHWGTCVLTLLDALHLL